MGRIRPEPLDSFATALLFNWRLAALRKCLVVLEGNGIVRYIGQDRWELDPKYADAGSAVQAARDAQFDGHRRHE